MRLIQFASITKKMALAAVGLFLLVFLPVHMGLNLFILRDDGGEWYRIACHFMGTNWIVKVFELALFGSIGLHILMGLIITVENWIARPVRYKVASKSKTHFMSKNMIWTGIIIACFLLLHCVNFYFVKLGLLEGKYFAEMEQVEKGFKQKAVMIQNGELSEEEQESLMNQLQALSQLPEDKMDDKLKLSLQSGAANSEGNIVNLSKDEVKLYCGEDFTHYEPDFYVMSKELFENNLYVLVYLLMFVVLGFHLFHAINSVAQTFGLNHKKYTPIIEWVAIAYAIIIPIGFSVVPLWVMFFV